MAHKKNKAHWIDIKIGIVIEWFLLKKAKYVFFFIVD